MRYLNPKADLAFKRVSGEHPDLVMILLNALLPLDPAGIEYPPSEMVPENPRVKKAVNALEESAFTPAQLLGYEKFRDIIRVEKALIYSVERKGLEKGRAGSDREIARKMKAKGFSLEDIVGMTSLSPEGIARL